MRGLILLITVVLYVSIGIVVESAFDSHPVTGFTFFMFGFLHTWLQFHLNEKNSDSE